MYEYESLCICHGYLYMCVFLSRLYRAYLLLFFVDIDAINQRPTSLTYALGTFAHLALLFHRLSPLVAPAHTCHTFLVIVNVVLSPRLPPVFSLGLAVAPILLAPFPLLCYRELRVVRGTNTNITATNGKQ